MVIIRLWYIFFILFKVVVQISGTTHWVVTENGRIQSHLDSPFHLRRPYDLLALLDQETRRKDISSLYHDLVSRKNLIDQKWSGLEGASDLETRIYYQDPDCANAAKLLDEFNLYPSIGTNGSNRNGINIKFNTNEVKESKDYLVPDCSKFVNLDFSMFAFEHLPAMINRSKISFEPEENLQKLMPVASMKQFGHEIAVELSKNSTSWLHYNLAALYWRIKGNAQKGIECGRRAVHFSPRRYRDIPLLNLASMFHQARYSRDAAVVLHAAIDHAPLQPANYHVLGNVYAVLAEYNRSVACFNNLLKLQPEMEEIKSVRHAVLCHHKFESELMRLHESLQGILSELHDYHSQQQQWVRLQERMLWEQAPSEVDLASYSSDKLAAMMNKRGQRCVQRNGDDSKPVITCDFTDDHAATNLQVDITLSLQRLLRNVESETKKITEHMSRGKGEVNKVVQKHVIEPLKKEINSLPNVKPDSVMPPMTHEKFPTSFSSSVNQYFDVTGWPKKEECLKWNLPIMEEDELDVPVFLPPENKGYQINKMLSDHIDLPFGSEHELPWYPPVCEFPDEDDKAHRPLSLRQSDNNRLKVNDHLKRHLMKYVNGGKGEEAEIGQRIITAMHKKAGPGWVLATLASLYWRVRSNTRKALNCLEVAFQSVPKDYTDVILVSYGSIFHQHGLVDDAIKFAMHAFKVNYVEPSTNFLLALLHYAKKNPILAMYYMKNAVRADPNYYDGKAETLLKTWACRIKLGGYEDVIKHENVEDGMCAERETFNGEGVVCSANGEQCKTATIQCFRAESFGDDPDDPNSGILSGQQCNKYKSGLGQSLMSTLLTLEGSGGAEPDQSQLESMVESQQQFQMRFAVADENGGSQTGDPYDSPVPEAMLHVFDKTGTYPLSPNSCKRIMDADWLHFSSMWQSIAARNVDISPFLKPMPKNVKEDLKPFCSYSMPSTSGTLDHLTVMILKQKLPNSPEIGLSEWLGLMAGDQQATIRELGAKISIALKENTTSWILATAAALYWRVVGKTKEAVTCLRQALVFVPSDMKDIPLISLANVLQRIGLYADALEVAYVALDSHPDFVVNPFTVGNIHTSMGELEKAISFYRSSLAIDANFEPARNRLQAILCTLLFDEAGSLRDASGN